MASWAVKRRFLYGGSVIIVLILIFFGIFWKIIYHAPTCSDGIKNGDELGVDCGGSCKNLCTSDALTPVVLWSKIFNISGDVYSAVAYIENPNLSSKNQSADYQFRIYNGSGNLITVKDGRTSIPKGKKFAVFETGIILKNNKPKSADFQFLSFSNWEKDTSREPEISVEHGAIASASTTPSVTGTIYNKSLQNIPRVELSVFIFDSRENVIAVSGTFVDNLMKNSSQDFIFTWQRPFDNQASVINVAYWIKP